MKIKIFAKNKKNLKEFKNKLKEYEKLFTLSNKPEIILCYGGDGTFLHAERLHPGIPKVIIRDESICKLCCEGNIEHLLKRLFEKKYEIITQNKIEAIMKNKRILLAANDIVIRNADQHHAIRFNVETQNKKFNDIIGDGVVIATPFGSTAYFNSITKKEFKQGIGLAFNNITTNQEFIIEENPIIKFKLLRNKAYMTSDNHSKKKILKENKEVTIKKSEEVFRIINIK